MNHRSRAMSRVAVPILLAGALSMLVVGATLARGGRPGGGGGKTCTQAAPGVVVDNNWAWSNWGSWGYPGQKLAYAINVINYDVGCASGTFVVDVQVPADFTVSVPASSISLKAGGTGYLWAYVTSPGDATDGNYPVVATVRRSGTSGPVGTFASSYMLYSTDSTDPTLFWQNPGDGQVVDGRTINITVSSSDDHGVQTIDLYIDGGVVTTAACDNVTYICQLSYEWSASGGSHVATFVSHDWMGNTGSLSVSFSVGGTTAKTSTVTTSTTLAAPSSDDGSSGAGDRGHGRSPDTSGGSKGKSSEHGPNK